MLGFLLGMVTGVALYWLWDRFGRPLVVSRPELRPVARLEIPGEAEVHGRPEAPLPARRPPRAEPRHPTAEEMP